MGDILEQIFISKIVRRKNCFLLIIVTYSLKLPIVIDFIKYFIDKSYCGLLLKNPIYFDNLITSFSFNTKKISRKILIATMTLGETFGIELYIAYPLDTQ